MQGSKFFRSGSKVSRPNAERVATPRTPRLPFSAAGNAAVSSGVRGSGFSRLASSKGLSRGAILADVFMVVIWGATIPGLMWLGAAGGF